MRSAQNESPPGSATTAEHRSRRRQGARIRKLKSKAGKAAPFLLHHGDNSIPTYGDEGSDSQTREATVVLVAYLKAREAEDWRTACSYLALPPSRQAEILARASGGHGKGCVSSLSTLAHYSTRAEQADPFSGTLVAFRVRGVHAFALFYGPGNQQYMMPMVIESHWKVNQIAPVTYPPGAPTKGG